jgi:hypothetical protein
MVRESLLNLVENIEASNFKGWDPYDTLNSPLNLKVLGKWIPILAIQAQKRNPINIRPILGIKKDYNPKGIALFLKAYLLLYKKTGEKKYLEKANWLFDWLDNNYTKGFSGKCWGYNFCWANPGGSLPAYTPSVVVTSFVIDGIFEYYKITNNQKAKEAIISSAEYIKNDIPITSHKEGISFAYTHLSKDSCYNASLLAAEILSKADFVSKSSESNVLVNKAIDFILSRQKPDGEWWYSYNPETGKERNQIDFHQGFILVSLENLNGLFTLPRIDVTKSIGRGLFYYRNNQFFENGQALWRIPQKWPVDIHSQSQGIITFSRLKEYNVDYLGFATKIAEWTITKMQSSKGYFYYRKTPFFINKIPYMRWSQAWMMLALSELQSNE